MSSCTQMSNRCLQLGQGNLAPTMVEDWYATAARGGRIDDTTRTFILGKDTRYLVRVINGPARRCCVLEVQDGLGEELPRHDACAFVVGDGGIRDDGERSMEFKGGVRMEQKLLQILVEILRELVLDGGGSTDAWLHQRLVQRQASRLAGIRYDEKWIVIECHLYMDRSL